MPDRAWKQTERAIASLLDGQRVPVSGRGRGDEPDIRHPRFSFEIKHKKTLPAWLLDALAQALAARRGAQLPVVILHQHGTRHPADLVVMRLGDFLTLTRHGCPPDAPRSPENDDTQGDDVQCL